jgi:hypothetical protein
MQNNLAEFLLLGACLQFFIFNIIFSEITKLYSKLTNYKNVPQLYAGCWVDVDEI